MRKKRRTKVSKRIMAMMKKIRIKIATMNI